MKTQILLVALSALTLNCYAQVPNGGFEFWIDNKGVLEPQAWITQNTFEVQSTLRDENAFEGEYAMRVVAVPHPLGMYGEAYCIIPLSSVPASLDFSMSCATDFGTVGVAIELFNGETQVYAYPFFQSQIVAEWFQVSLPLTPPAVPITQAIIRVSAMVGDFAPGSAWIAVDAMNFSGIQNTGNIEGNNKAVIYPNPGDGHINLEKGDWQFDYLRISDLTGKTVFESNSVLNKRTLDVSWLPCGLYLVTLTGQGEGSTEMFRYIKTK